MSACVCRKARYMCAGASVCVRKKRNLNLYEHRWVRVCVLVTDIGLNDERVT